MIFEIKRLHRLIGEDIELVWKPRPESWKVKVDPAQVAAFERRSLVNTPFIR